MIRQRKRPWRRCRRLQPVSPSWRAIAFVATQAALYAVAAVLGSAKLARVVADCIALVLVVSIALYLLAIVAAVISAVLP